MMDCSDCGRCCGVVPFNKTVFDRLVREGKAQRGFVAQNAGRGVVLPETEDALCVFLTAEKKCAVYDDRPRICRLYGTVDELPCPFYHADGARRTESEEKSMKERIDAEIDRKIERLKAVAAEQTLRKV